MAISNTYDVAILGSGFGASLLASILSKSGMEVCLIDQRSHPRFTIGESSTPAADMILQDLCRTYGLDELLPLCRFGTWQGSYPNIRCGCKRGFSYIWHGSGADYHSSANHKNELLVAASSNRQVADTQWYRADVDQFFCQFAIDCGTSYFSDSTVPQIQHAAESKWSLSLDSKEGSKSVHSRFLIDATGPAGLLMKELEVPEMTHLLQTKTSAIYSHFKNVPLMTDWLAGQGTDQSDFPYPVDDSAVHHVFQDGWLWQLRFEDGLTSLGYVFHESPKSHLVEKSAHETWQELLKQKPVLNEMLKGSSLSSFPGEMFQTDRLQRLYQHAAGKDWAALPFTVGFIDPLHSTGIAHTLLGVKRLAAALIETNQPACREQFRLYSSQIVAELQHIDRLVSICYQNLGNFSRFSAACMLYFAAATTFERNFHAGSDDGFLCAADPAFRKVLKEISLSDSTALHETHAGDDRSQAFIQKVEAGISPYNHVGLFCPQHPNMYHSTAAEK